ncbi:MAG: hypothetical protein JNJ85_02455 [Candidatus Kapabacteria bacterium]|nr:hypothetical protein [Candidatus Kapabacteria bacterium]
MNNGTFLNTKIQCPVCGKQHLNPFKDGRGGFCHGSCNRTIFFNQRHKKHIGFESIQKLIDWYSNKKQVRFCDVYSYLKADGGSHSAMVKFYDRDNTKTYLPARLQENHWYIGKAPELILYNLPNVLKAKETGTTIYLCEGEKDSDTLTNLGFVATTNPFGAKNWNQNFTELLSNCDVVLCSDNDDAGNERNEFLEVKLRKLVQCLSILNIGKHFPDCNDVTDVVNKLKSQGEVNIKQLLQSRIEILYNNKSVTSSDKETEAELLTPEQQKLMIYRVEKWLRSNYNFRYNVISNFVEFQKVDTDSWQELNDRGLASLHRKILHNNLKINDKGLHKLLHSDFTTEYHPFSEYFKNLPKPTTSGAVTKVFDLLKMPDTDRAYLEPFFRKWLLNIIGCSFGKSVNDVCLILCGPQGCGKTTFLRNLVPKKLMPYYVESLFSPDSKDAEVAICQNFLINLDELEAFDRKSIKSLKSIISRTHVKLRRAYGVNDSRMNRVASFCGSSNDQSILVDDTGERRYLCIEVDDIEHSPNIKKLVEDMWAELYQVYLSGEQYRFQKQELLELSQRNEQFKFNSLEYELLNQYFIPGNQDNSDTEYLQASRILLELQEISSVKNLNLKILGSALKRCNFKTSSKRLPNMSNSCKAYAVIRTQQ